MSEDGEGVFKTDDVIWEFKDIKEGDERKCEIHSRSMGRDIGYDDNGRNFCNMYNAFRVQQFTHEEPQLTNCEFHPRVMYAHDVWKHCGHDEYFKTIEKDNDDEEAQEEDDEDDEEEDLDILQ